VIGGTNSNADDIAIAKAPFALDAEDRPLDVESEVIPTMLGEGFKHRDSESCGFLGNRQLGKIAFVIGASHEQMFVRSLSRIKT
jgi:hypothetical protein